MKLTDYRTRRAEIIRNIDVLDHHYPPHPNRKNTAENVKASLRLFLDGATVKECAEMHGTGVGPGGMRLILEASIRKILKGMPTN